MHILLLVLYGALNRVRGGAILPKLPCYMLFGVLACFTAALGDMDGGIMFWLLLWLLAFGGNYFGFMFCWAKYFPDPVDTSTHHCLPLVDNLASKICGYTYTSTTPIPQALNWKTVAFSLRWLIFFAPKYIILIIFHVLHGTTASMLPAIFGCFILLAIVGLIYRFWFDWCAAHPRYAQYNVMFSEITTGFLVVGVCDWLVL